MSLFFTGGVDPNFKSTPEPPYYERQINAMNEEGKKALGIFLDKQEERYNKNEMNTPYMKLNEEEKQKLLEGWKELFVYRNNKPEYAKNFIS